MVEKKSVLKIYNTLTRKKETFKPIKKEEVRMYVCGPTVNDVPHLGHAKAQISFDIFRRYLEFLDYKVNFISNVTDIDDKIINKANELGISIKELTEKNTKAHIEDYKELNVLEPTKRTYATKFVKEMIDLISVLEKKGYTYIIDGDGIYFDISKFKDYGKLSHQRIEDLKSGSRKEINDNKKSPQDFVLWKFSKPNEPKWDAPWGPGRPGWHIECSAMTKSVLGLPFDIHGGGADLIFPHHEDEMAQSEAAYGKFANYWVHNGMVNIEGTKMSKSLGNFKTVKDLLEKYSAMTIRYFVISTQYDKPTDFSEQALDDAKNSYERMKRLTEKIQDDSELNGKYLEEFKEAMNDDLNTPKALAVLWELVRDEKATGKYQTIKKMDEVFGLKLFEQEKLDVPEEIRLLAEQRWKAKKDKNFKLSDEIRKKISDMGFNVNDTKDGWEVKRI
jgi:cysteinyl-tRNA synthetase